MTAFAIDYRADRVAVASDTLCYSGPRSIGHVGKVYQLPHIRSVFFGQGSLDLTVKAVAQLMLSPTVFCIEDAAAALPGILRDLTQLHVEENELGDPTGLRLLECTLAGWSEAEGRMRLWQFLSAEDYAPHAEFDTRYGGPYPIPPLHPSFFPHDRAGDTIETKLTGILHAHDRFCAEHPEIAGGVRLGGEIALTTLTEQGISHRSIGCFPGYEATLQECADDEEPPRAAPESQHTAAAPRPLTNADRKKADRRKAERKARKISRKRR